MQLRISDDLPFTTVTISYQGMEVVIPNVLIDTGSATSIFNADQLGKINLTPNPDDILFTIRGVGGTEVVFSRRVDSIQLGDKKIPDFQIEIGGMDYGFDILGILGMDFLVQAGAVIDLHDLTLLFHSA
jgi:predicted aspartyl protease